MSNKYRQAVANAMMGKCIAYKKETKAVLNEMLDIVIKQPGHWLNFAKSHINRQIYTNETKIDIYDQVVFQFDEFIEYVWSFKE